MKFTLSFKTPDVLDQIDKPSLCEECKEELEDEWCEECCLKTNEYLDTKAMAQDFVKYDEYISIEFDTEKKTATVLKQ